jgi:translation initiation factor 2 beta subunit (eIF-2beta)/eIF-5
MNKVIRKFFLSNFILILCCLIPPIYSAEIQIVDISGDVKFRRGVEENWHIAQKDVLLEEIDSIWTGEDGQAVLQLNDNRQFTLEQNSLLDIADLRNIKQEDLFIILMKQKIRKIDNGEQKIQLQIGTVSVVHGSSEDSSRMYIETDTLQHQEAVKNGIRALFNQQFYANTIVKIQQYFNYFVVLSDCGEMDYYVGKSFEMLNQFGQAIDAYETSIAKNKNENCPHQKWGKLSATRIEQIKKVQ